MWGGMLTQTTLSPGHDMLGPAAAVGAAGTGATAVLGGVVAGAGVMVAGRAVAASLKLVAPPWCEQAPRLLLPLQEVASLQVAVICACAATNRPATTMAIWISVHNAFPFIERVAQLEMKAYCRRSAPAFARP